jgi:hypothetical protein
MFNECDITADLTLDAAWMYQNLPGQSNSAIAAMAANIDDPLDNSSYTYTWEFMPPSDTTATPVTLAGGGPADDAWLFAAPACDTNGLSDSGIPHVVRVTLTGNDHGNTGMAEAEFGICLLGDVNHEGVVNVADRSIVNAFWRTGSAGSFTLRDCDVNGDGVMSVADRSIVNAIWRGMLCSNSVGTTCPLCGTESSAAAARWPTDERKSSGRKTPRQDAHRWSRRK